MIQSCFLLPWFILTVDLPSEFNMILFSQGKRRSLLKIMNLKFYSRQGREQVIEDVFFSTIYVVCGAYCVQVEGPMRFPMEAIRDPKHSHFHLVRIRFNLFVLVQPAFQLHKTPLRDDPSALGSEEK